MYRLPDELVSSIRFVRGLNPYKVGDIVAGDEYRTWPESNRRAIVDQGFVELIGGQPAEGVAALDRGDLVRVVVPRLDNLYDVVEGRKINETPLADEAATALADELPTETPDEPEPVRMPAGLPQKPAGEDDGPLGEILPEQKKRTHGRPKGSKNKPKAKSKTAKRQSSQIEQPLAAAK